MMRPQAWAGAFFAVLLAGSLWSQRTAFDVVLGDNAQDNDCSYQRATFTSTITITSTATPTPTPTPSPSPDVALEAIQELGFEAEWEEVAVLKVTLSDVSARFDKAKAELKPEAIERLKRLSLMLNQYPGSTLQVDGHTDRDGNEAFNGRLSLKRAEMVRDVMIGMGVPAGTFVSVSGWASAQPLHKKGELGEVDDAAQNRRVEVRVHMISPALVAPPSATPSPTREIELSPDPSPLPTAEPNMPTAPEVAPQNP